MNEKRHEEEGVEPQEQETREEAGEKSADQGSKENSFQSSTSRSTWQRLRSGADRLVHKTIETAGDVAQRGRIELEITSLRYRLKSLYAKIGDKVFHLSEAEEHPDPLTDPVVSDLFEQVRSTLSHLASERKRLEKLREESSTQSAFMGS